MRGWHLIAWNRAFLKGIDVSPHERQHRMKVEKKRARIFIVKFFALLTIWSPVTSHTSVAAATRAGYEYFVDVAAAAPRTRFVDGSYIAAKAAATAADVAAPSCLVVASSHYRYVDAATAAAPFPTGFPSCYRYVDAATATVPLGACFIGASPYRYTYAAPAAAAPFCSVFVGAVRIRYRYVDAANSAAPSCSRFGAALSHAGSVDSDDIAAPSCALTVSIDGANIAAAAAAAHTRSMGDVRAQFIDGSDVASARRAQSIGSADATSARRA
ncbi:uncharacterized protein LOC120107691 [Phoenix dactylifera]|uniref:Uncharacterized protein LOC120107691 n=1 Tax=Phoenix dactylifera TaxID=42345 RepID=A0A8B9A0L5_PHODC|nr:uncharacterized protein LOC120107691 [Phoenix dactylifera]